MMFVRVFVRDPYTVEIGANVIKSDTKSIISLLHEHKSVFASSLVHMPRIDPKILFIDSMSTSPSLGQEKATYIQLRRIIGAKSFNKEGALISNGPFERKNFKQGKTI